MSATQSTAQARPVAAAKSSTMRSVFANWAGLGTNAVLSVVLTPILVHGLGNLYFGLYMLVSSVLDSCWLLDFGMRTALFRFISRSLGAGDRDELDRTFVSGMALACASASCILLLALAGMAVLPHFFGLPLEERATFRILLVLCGGAVASAFLAQFLGTYLCAFRRFDFYNLNNAAAGILRAVLIVVALRMGGRVLAVGAVTLTCAVLSLLVALRLVWVADPGLRVAAHNFSRARVRELLNFSGGAFLATLGDQLRFFVDSVVIGRLLGVAAITPFVIPGRIMVLYRELGMSLASPLAGTMNEAAGRHDQPSLTARFLHATRMSALLSLFVGCILLLNGDGLIRLWVGSAFASSYQLMLILLAGYVLMLAQQPSVDLLLAQGKHHLRGWWNLGEGAANLALSVYWGQRYGLVGIALGTAAPMICVQLVLQPWYATRTIGLPVGHYLREALLRPVLVAAVVLCVCAAARTWQHAYSPWWLALSVAWQSALFLLLAWVIALRAEERTQLLNRVLSRR